MRCCSMGATTAEHAGGAQCAQRGSEHVRAAARGTGTEVWTKRQQHLKAAGYPACFGPTRMWLSRSFLVGGGRADADMSSSSSEMSTAANWVGGLLKVFPCRVERMTLFVRDDNWRAHNPRQLGPFDARGAHRITIRGDQGHRVGF